MMNKHEFLIRLTKIGKGKIFFFKQLYNLFNNKIPNQIDANKLLSELELSNLQKALFWDVTQQYITPVIMWLTDLNHLQLHHLIYYNDPEYPLLLKQISSPPVLLFVKGDKKLLNSPQIAMVGSRNFSEYGARWGRYFANELALNGLTITSGLALGIDAICHRGALDVEGKTIAVLGSGLANIIPRTHQQLADEILAAKGAIISEFFPFESARPEYFPRRNRIISGLSLGTFIVEASQKSGSLITARYALEQNRDVFALPGDINNNNCQGTHWLIKQGAYLVTEPTDILEHYCHYLSTIKPTSGLKNREQKAILHPEILALLHTQPIPIDIIASQLNLSISEVTIKLLEMELAGLIKTVTGGYVLDVAI